jgi:type II secretory pathway predicted ATPase ExeA
MGGQSYLAFFGLQRQPFGADLDLNQILETPALRAAADRLEYAAGIGAIALVTGDVGAGKSTARRWITGRLHPSRHKVVCAPS